MRPPRLPPPIELAPRRLAGPLTRAEGREARAVRMAAVILLIAVHGTTACDGHGAVGSSDGYRIWAWARRRLRPLARWSPFARGCFHVLSEQVYGRAWYDDTALRRQVRALDRRTTRLEQHLAAEPRAPLRLVDDEPIHEDLFAESPPTGRGVR